MKDAGVVFHNPNPEICVISESPDVEETLRAEPWAKLEYILNFR